MHRCGVVGPNPCCSLPIAHCPLPIAILIMLVPLMRIGVHAMANVGGRYVSLDMPHAEPDLSTTLLANLKAHIAGGVIEASGNV